MWLAAAAAVVPERAGPLEVELGVAEEGAVEQLVRVRVRTRARARARARARVRVRSLCVSGVPAAAAA